MMTETATINEQPGQQHAIVLPPDREQAFREAIAVVCREHGAELNVTDDGRPYGMHSGVLIVSMASVYDGDRLVKEFCEFDW